MGRRIVKGEKTTEELINISESVLNKYLLPYISTKSGDNNKKAYFIGYMIYRCGNCF